MSIEELISLMENELKCITKPDCDRNCNLCELIKEQSELETAYKQVISILKKNSTTRNGQGTPGKTSANEG